MKRSQRSEGEPRSPLLRRRFMPLNELAETTQASDHAASKVLIVEPATKGEGSESRTMFLEK